MICKVCNTVPNSERNEDCFEKALDALKKHYDFYKNAIHQRDLEVQQIKDRNEKLNKALQLLQLKQQPTKRFKSQNSDGSWLGNISPHAEHHTSEYSSTDDEQVGANNLNMALNSEQLFDTSLLSETNNDASRSSSEVIQSPRRKEPPKKQHELKRFLKDRNNTGLARSKSEWNTKERNSQVESSWAMKFVNPVKLKDSKGKVGDLSKNVLDKKVSMSLKKRNPSKIKQSLIQFNKLKETSLRESVVKEDIIEASPDVMTTNSKSSPSWSHRSVQNSIKLANTTNKEDVTCNKTLDDIVFDFSPSKKEDSLLNIVHSHKVMKPKSLKFINEDYSHCISLPNDIDLGMSSNKSDSSSLVILTPRTQDIIFVEDDTCNIEPEIDTMDLLTDNLDKLRKYESKCIIKQQSKDLEAFKMPPANATSINQQKIKQEKRTQEILKDSKITLAADEAKNPCCSNSKNNLKAPKENNSMISSDKHDMEKDSDFMPKPFLIKQETENTKVAKKLSIKQRFNIECEDCEKLIDFLDEKLTPAQIQQHLDKCKHHNNANFMRQNTPNDFWNPFILSFQDDDPRNEILIDNRFKDNKK